MISSINKAHVEATKKIVPKHSSRYNMAYFNKNKFVVTDGYRLVEITDNRIEDGEHIIEAEDIKKLKPKNDTPFLVGQKDDDNTFFAIGYGNETTPLKDVTTEKQFPVYDSILPKDHAENTVVLNAKYLKELCEVVIASGNETLELSLTTDTSPVYITTGKTALIEQIRIVLMPIIK